MARPVISPRTIWKTALYMSGTWVLCVLIFIDLCLSFGGGNNSSCQSTFSYPEIVAVLAMMGVFYLPPLTLLVAGIALIATLIAVFKSR